MLILLLLLLFLLRDIKVIHLAKVCFCTLFLYMDLLGPIITPHLPPTPLPKYGLIHLFPYPLFPCLILKALLFGLDIFISHLLTNLLL